MTLGVPKNLVRPEDALSATDEVLLPYVLAAEQGGTVFCTSANAPTVELVPLHVRDEFEETLECLRQLERVRRELGGQGASEPPPVAWDSVPSRSGQSSIASRSGQSPNLHLGKFEIVRELGRGGFAIVYLARDIRLRRDVALKIPRPDVLLSPEMRDRFAREARAAAALDHPNIVPVLEVGNDELQCWIAYAHCEGPTLTQWLASRDEPVHARDAAQLVAQLAEAVQHAHSRGILHRDIKPSNVLLEGVEHRELRVKTSEEKCGDLSDAKNTGGLMPPRSPTTPCVRLTDFGLAKVFDDDEPETRTGVVIGTADYMAPEQARGDNKEVSAATDVFALGVILYELLAGQPPFRGATTHETLQRLQNEEPTRLANSFNRKPEACASWAMSDWRARLRLAVQRVSHPAPRVPYDLETICWKCLEKDTQRRYASAAALADDLQRFLAGEPILARPAGWAERLLKWMRRRPAVASGLTLVVILILSLGTFGWWHAIQLERYSHELESSIRIQKQETKTAQEQRELAQKRSDQIRRRDYIADLRVAQQYVESGQLEDAVTWLNRLRPQSGEADYRGFEWYYSWSRCHDTLFPLVGHSNYVYSVMFSPGGRRLLSGGGDGTARIWDVETGQELLRMPHPNGLRRAAFSPNGELCVTVARDPVVRVWDTRSGQMVKSFSDHPAIVRAAIFSHDGKWLITSDHHGDIRIRSTTTWELLRHIQHHVVVAWDGIALSADRRWLVVCQEGASRIWLLDLVQEPLLSSYPLGGPASLLCPAPSGRRVFIGREDGSIQILNLLPDVSMKPVEPSPEPPHPSRFDFLACSPDEHKLLSVGADRTVRRWQVPSLTSHDIPLRANQQAVSAAFSPDGKTFAVGGTAGLIGIGQCDPPVAPQLGHLAAAWGVAFSPDGEVLASASDDLMTCLWKWKTNVPSRRLLGHLATVSSVTFSPDGKTLATSSLDRTVKLWDVETGALRQTLNGHTDRVRSVAYSADSHWLASSGYDARVLLWNAETGKLHKTLMGDDRRLRGMAFSPDGTTLAVGSESGKVLIWNFDSGQSLPSFDNDRQQVWTVCFADDGRHLLTGDELGAVKLWDVDSRRVVLNHQAHAGGVRAAIFTPDGLRFVSAGEDQTIKVWDRETGLQLTTLRGHEAAIYGLAITPDSRTLASCSYDGAVKIWRGESASR